MGDALVSTLVKEVLGRLTSVALQEFALLSGFEDDILTLKHDFDQIEAVLQDAEEKHVKEKAVEVWLKSLRSASLMAENVLDEVSTQALLQRLYKQRVKYRVRAFFSLNRNMFVSRVRIAHKVKEIRRKLDYIASKRSELNLTPSGVISLVDDVGVEMPSRETSSFIYDSSVIFGRDEEVELVAGKICNKDIGKYENGEIRVYGIWGMGGLGKTTLAQLVYNHEKVNQYFNIKCWVYVSENFEVQEIIKKIIESIDKHVCTLTQLETLQESLQSKLSDKQFLIVLDDVWIEYSEKNKWDQLSKILSCGVEGSIVMMTTRSHTTCRMMAKDPDFIQKLGCLSEEDSWSLFKKLAFAQGRNGDDISELEPIGKMIVEKCNGMPLAVKTLGSLMWSKSTKSEWQSVKDNNIWELEEIKVLPAILKLSYDNLLPHLKRCFAYCCLFPKGHAMDKDELITLWVSNGFIPPKGDIDLYVLGEEVFNCLVWRSFFIVKVESRGNIYLMHDLMYDMARHVMGDDCLVVNPGKEIIVPNEALHLSSSCPNFQFSAQDLGKLKSLRSIFMFGEDYEYSISQISSHVYLRVLYMYNIKLKTLPRSICKLQHLRYLNLSSSSIEVLSESIIYLQNLQVLLLNSCIYLYKLPDGIRYMRNLQRLDIGDCYSLRRLPCGIKELTSIHTLAMFPLCNMRGARIGELENLNLEGELSIRGLENVGGLNEAKSANLKSKTNLSALELSWSDTDSRDRMGESFAHDGEVLEGLELNSSLKKLTINYYMQNIISPSWMVNLRNLVEIRFWFCRNCVYIPALGRLPNLKIIHLERMNSLKYFHHDDTNMEEDTTDMFLSLQKLYIDRCPELVSLPSNLPKLEVLSLKNCGELVSLPDEIESFKNLNELVIRDCKHLWERYREKTGVDWHKISHIPMIRITKR